MENIVFTPASVLSLLTKIDELKDLAIGLTETIDGRLQLQVGDSIYELQNDYMVNIPVDDSVVETIDDVNQDTYEELADDGEIDFQESITSGVLKELAKTLLVGGMVRLTGKILKND